MASLQEFVAQWKNWTALSATQAPQTAVTTSDAKRFSFADVTWIETDSSSEEDDTISKKPTKTRMAKKESMRPPALSLRHHADPIYLRRN